MYKVLAFLHIYIRGLNLCYLCYVHAHIWTERESTVKGTMILLIGVPRLFPGNAGYCPLEAQHALYSIEPRTPQPF